MECAFWFSLFFSRVVTCCEICAILAYQNEHLEACAARYDFIPYIIQARGHGNKSAVYFNAPPVNKDICTESVMPVNVLVSLQDIVRMWQYKCVCVVGGHSLVSGSRSAPAVKLCDPGGFVERGLHLCRDVQKKVSKAHPVEPLIIAFLTHTFPFHPYIHTSYRLADGNQIKWCRYAFQSTYSSHRLKGTSQAWVTWSLCRVLALSVGFIQKVTSHVQYLTFGQSFKVNSQLRYGVLQFTVYPQVLISIDVRDVFKLSKLILNSFEKDLL